LSPLSFITTPTTPHPYTLSLHDALPISAPGKLREAIVQAAARKLEACGVEKRLTENRVVLEDAGDIAGLLQGSPRARILTKILRSEEHTSELQSRFDLVCRLLLEKKKKK